MYEFLVDISLPVPFSEKFLRLIPAQRERVRILMETGIISSYLLSGDYTNAWITIAADTEEDVVGVLDSLPLFSFVEGFSIHPLAFHQTIETMLPSISLN